MNYGQRALLWQVKLRHLEDVDCIDVKSKEVSVGISQGFAFGLALFTIFINKLDEKAEGTFTSFIKLMADTK